MGNLGVHFALTTQDIADLRAIPAGPKRVVHVQNVIEPRDFDTEWACETDKAWDAIHRCFAAGTLKPDAGDYPLNHAILGGESLHKSVDHILSLKTPAQAAVIAAALAPIARDDLHARYKRIRSGDYGMPLSAEDFDYTWEYFSALPDFYTRAARAARHVLFTASQ